eukprot:s3114_g9.t2
MPFVSLLQCIWFPLLKCLPKSSHRSTRIEEKRWFEVARSFKHANSMDQAEPWPPAKLADTLGSDDWQLSMARAGVLRPCQNRFDFQDTCKDTGNSPQVRICGDHWCDEYSVGSGYCQVYPPDGAFFEIGSGSSAPLIVVTSHCAAKRANSSQLFLCPLRAPIAVALMLKAGSSSVGAWLHALDSSSRPAEFSRRLFGAFEDNELAVSPKFLSWIFGPDGLGASVTARLRPSARRALVKRFFFETRPQKTASKLLLPPGWCMPCCAAGSGRLPVMLVRSPYRRVHSYFRHKWLANPSKEPLTGWKDLPEFVRKLAEHRTLNRSLPPLFTKQDLYHTLSFHDILRDIRWSAAAREVMRLRMCVLRLEVLHMDLIHLHAVLCRWFRFCERLPAIPEIIPTGLRPYLAVPSPPWETLWTKDAVQNMRQLFASDFEELGYSVDPLQTAPERRAPCWMRA